MLIALSCGICEQLMIGYGHPGLIPFLITVATSAAIASLLCVVTARLSVLAIILRVLAVMGVSWLAFIISGAYTFSGATLGLAAFAIAFTRKYAPEPRKKLVAQSIWATASLAVLVSIPFCINFNRKQLAIQPQRVAEALVQGEITARWAEKDLKAMTNATDWDKLAPYLRASLIQPSDRAIIRYAKPRVVSVLVTWGDQGAIPFIAEAAKKGYISQPDAQAALDELKRKSA